MWFHIFILTTLLSGILTENSKCKENETRNVLCESSCNYKQFPRNISSVFNTCKCKNGYAKDHHQECVPLEECGKSCNRNEEMIKQIDKTECVVMCQCNNNSMLINHKCVPLEEKVNDVVFPKDIKVLKRGKRSCSKQDCCKFRNCDCDCKENHHIEYKPKRCEHVQHDYRDWGFQVVFNSTCCKPNENLETLKSEWKEATCQGGKNVEEGPYCTCEKGYVKDELSLHCVKFCPRNDGLSSVSHERFEIGGIERYCQNISNPQTPDIGYFCKPRYGRNAVRECVLCETL